MRTECLTRAKSACPFKIFKYICLLIFKEKNSNIVFKEKFKNYKKKKERGEYRRIRLNGVMHVRTVKFKVESK